MCGIVAGDPSFPADIVYRDDNHIAFLNRFPTQIGYLLVAPIDHRENLVGDFTLDEYLALQSLVYRLGRAVSAVVPTERLYLLSLGSQQRSRHVHWHLAPLPPKVPYEGQQFAALMVERAGYLDLTAEERSDLAARVRDAIH